MQWAVSRPAHTPSSSNAANPTPIAAAGNDQDHQTDDGAHDRRRRPTPHGREATARVAGSPSTSRSAQSSTRQVELCTLLTEVRGDPPTALVSLALAAL